MTYGFTLLNMVVHCTWQYKVVQGKSKCTLCSATFKVEENKSAFILLMFDSGAEIQPYLSHFTPKGKNKGTLLYLTLKVEKS